MTDETNLVLAEVCLVDAPADTVDQVKEAARRVGLPLTGEPQPEEPESGIWLLPVQPVVVHRLFEDGATDLIYRLADSAIVIPVP